MVNSPFGVCLFWLKRVSRNHFTPLYVFGKHKKLGQTEMNFRIDRKMTLLACKTLSSFILPSNQLDFSHTLSNLLTRTPHRHSPNSVVTKLHRARHAKRRSPSPSRQYELHPHSNDPPSILTRQPHLTSPPIHTPPTHPLQKQSTSPQTHLAKIHHQTHKQPKCYSHYLGSDLYIFIYLNI